SYVGLEFYPGVLAMARVLLETCGELKSASLVRSSAATLPLCDESADFILAFDVIEHLEDGKEAQLQMLAEVRRVLRKNGLLLLTTPNWVHPFDDHSLLFGPHYLPVFLADLYIRWRNPSFLQEHKTFENIRLLKPWELKRLLATAGLSLIHDFPWGLEF